MSRTSTVSATCDTIRLSAATVVETKPLRLPRYGGNYLGLARMGTVASPPTEIRLSIETHGASFAGRLRSFEQGNQVAAGTIASSGQNQITSESPEAQTTVRLDWQNHGGGAAMMTGDIASEVVGRRVVSSAALLRPFENPNIDWSRLTGRYPATFTSCNSRQTTEGSFDIFAGATGIFQARIPGWTDRRSAAVVIGATNVGDCLIAAGLGSDPAHIVTLTGTVQSNWDGLPVRLSGHYLLETSGGELVDVGRFQVQLQR